MHQLLVTTRRRAKIGPADLLKAHSHKSSDREPQVTQTPKISRCSFRCLINRRPALRDRGAGLDHESKHQRRYLSRNVFTFLPVHPRNQFTARECCSSITPLLRARCDKIVFSGGVNLVITVLR